MAPSPGKTETEVKVRRRRRRKNRKRKRSKRKKMKKKFLTNLTEKKLDKNLNIVECPGSVSRQSGRMRKMAAERFSEISNRRKVIAMH